MNAALPYHLTEPSWRKNATGTYIGAVVVFNSGLELKAFARKSRVKRRGAILGLGVANHDGWHLTITMPGIDHLGAVPTTATLGKFTAELAASKYLLANAAELIRTMAAVVEDESAHLEPR